MKTQHLKNIGIGIDIVETARFKKIPYESNKSFYKKIFTLSEITYCTKFKDSHLHFAGKFAAKEALVKSIPNKIKLLDISTSNSRSKPAISISKNKNYQFLVSISHEQNMAVAVVVSIRY
jgi:holo-[acyl-carrier protein] synthase